MALNDISKKEIGILKSKVDVFFNSQEATKLDHEEIAFIVKKIIFFKMLTGSTSQNLSIFFSRLISDLYCILDCLEKEQNRYYFFNYRSLIENYLRLLMNVTVEENHVTQDVFLKFKKKFTSEFISSDLILTEDEYSLIRSEYKESCQYVHGSDVLNDELIFVFEDFESNKIDNKKKKIEKIIQILKIFNRLLLFENFNLINGIFHRKKTSLEYLCGKDYIAQLDFVVNLRGLKKYNKEE